MVSDSETYSISEFFESLKPAKLDYLPRPSEEPWLVWSQENENDESEDHFLIREKIKLALLQFLQGKLKCSLIQFWAPKRRGGVSFLSTSDQPFSIINLSKNYASYRKQSMGQKIYFCGEGGEEVDKNKFGPVGRAFANQQPESSPDVRLYSLQEFPQRDYACRCGLSELIALPVFKTHGQICIGVLEVLGFLVGDIVGALVSFAQALKVVGLRLNHSYFQPDPKSQQDPWEEIKEAFKEVAATYPLALALAFIPSCGNDEYCPDDFDLSILKLIDEYNVSNMSHDHHFIIAHKAFYLQKGKGVAGKALASRKSIFCRNICDFSMTEYPLVHYARHARLTRSFAICLQTTQLENDHVVLEFFLLPGNDNDGYTLSFLESLLTKVKQHLHSFEVVSEVVSIEELCAKATNFSNDDEIGHLLETQNKGLSSGLQILQYDEEMEQLASEDQHVMLESDATKSDGHVLNAEENNAFVNHGEKRVKTATLKRQVKRQKPDITFDDLTKQFGKPLSDAALQLGVSRSTLKRLCRVYGIHRWPSHKKKVENTNVSPQGENGSTFVLGRKSLYTDLALQENDCDIGHVTLHGAMTQDARTVTVKALYGECTMIKFQLHFPSKLIELEEEVAKRLKLKIGSFHMMYQDEDNDWISVTCDDDLHLCMLSSTSGGRTVIKMSILLNSN